MIEVISEHSVEMSMIQPGCKVLDLGCRGFEFTNYFRNIGCEVLAVDADLLHGDIPYDRVAISDHDGLSELIYYSDPQATQIKDHYGPVTTGSNVVPTMTLQSYSNAFGVNEWDLIKMDIEGSEWEVIMSLDKAPCRQLSIEFHLHVRGYFQDHVDKMVAKLRSLGYFPILHTKSSRHGLTPNYWDSLFIHQDYL